MNWKYFIGSCILVAGFLIKVGAPLLAVVLGIAGAALINWKRQRA
jgi:uncharacterized membrane protein